MLSAQSTFFFSPLTQAPQIHSKINNRGAGRLTKKLNKTKQTHQGQVEGTATKSNTNNNKQATPTKEGLWVRGGWGGGGGE